MEDYSGINLRHASFVGQDLRYACFVNCDLRGANFNGADLSGADFSRAKTGITPMNVVFIFLLALVISLVAGYIAMLGGQTVQTMLASKNEQVRTAGVLSILITLCFILYTSWKGGGNAIKNLILPAILLALLMSLAAWLSGFGTGMGMLYLVLSLVLIIIMFIAGTIARTVAGTLSNVFFIIVALSGTLLGHSVGGDIITVVMSLACAYISKRAISGAEGFTLLNKVIISIIRVFGTSFRNAKMINTRFSRTVIRNTDFSNTDISRINWESVKKIRCIVGERTIFTTK